MSEELEEWLDTEYIEDPDPAQAAGDDASQWKTNNCPKLGSSVRQRSQPAALQWWGPFSPHAMHGRERYAL